MKYLWPVDFINSFKVSIVVKYSFLNNMNSEEKYFVTYLKFINPLTIIAYLHNI